MKNIFATIILIIFRVILLKAQVTETKPIKRNMFNFQVGFEYGYYKDLNYSPLNYSARGTVLGIEYQRLVHNQNRLFFSSNFQIGNLHSSASEYFVSKHYNLNLKLGYLVNIIPDASKAKIHLGGQLSSYTDAVLYNDTEAVTYFGLHSLDIKGSVTWNISDKHKVNSNLSVPVYGLLVRPPYSGFDKFMEESSYTNILFRGIWTSFNNYFAFNWSLQYECIVSDNWSVMAKYQFMYYKTKIPDIAIIPSNQFTIGFNFKF
jgi:hypothetical protein